jgi:ribonuclease HI
MKNIIIFCDGACSGNGQAENVGGWGAVLKHNDQVKEIYGGSDQTTNNIMELTAAIEALKQLKSKKLKVDIYSDSAYVVNCFRNGWYHKWLINGWQTSKKEPVENKLLWQTLIELVNSFEQVTFYKIKGHLDVKKTADVVKWHIKFNTDNKTNLTLEEFKSLIELNHLADALANKGMEPFKK